MTETVIATFLFAWLFKGYKWSEIFKLFKHWSIYPIVLTCLLHIYCVFLMIQGEYWFLEYAKEIKTISLLFYIILIYKYKLMDISIFNKINMVKNNKLLVWATSPFPIGALCAFIGSKLNQIAMFYNDGKMPVFPNVSIGTKYIKIDMFEKASVFKDFHSLGNYTTNLIFLTDIFDFFYVIMSVGDLLLRIFVVLVLYYSIKQCNSINNI